MVPGSFICVFLASSKQASQLYFSESLLRACRLPATTLPPGLLACLAGGLLRAWLRRPCCDNPCCGPAGCLRRPCCLPAALRLHAASLAATTLLPLAVGLPAACDDLAACLLPCWLDYWLAWRAGCCEPGRRPCCQGGKTAGLLGRRLQYVSYDELARTRLLSSFCANASAVARENVKFLPKTWIPLATSETKSKKRQAKSPLL